MAMDQACSEYITADSGGQALPCLGPFCEARQYEPAEKICVSSRCPAFPSIAPDVPGVDARLPTPDQTTYFLLAPLYDPVSQCSAKSSLSLP